MSDDRDSQDDSTRFAAAGGNDETRFTGVGSTQPATAAAPESTIAPGALLGHTYRITALLARGGMGEVYRARHAELGTEHAIKIILPELANESRIVDLFRREASVLRTVRHDAVVAYDGVFRDENGRLYLVMEFVDGPSLSKQLRQRPLRADEVRQLRDRLADGLAVAHEKGVIHRDISPDNVILPGGDLAQAKIIDFGISKMADPSQKTIVGDDFAGKYSYVSPEQLGMFGGKVDGRSDIYSLGLVLAAAAIGEPLDMGMSPISVIEARRAVPDLGRVPQEIRADLEAMLQPDPADRPQSMRDLVSGGTRKAEPSSRRPQERRPSNTTGKDRRQGLGNVTKITAAAIVAVLLGIGGYYLIPSTTQPQPPTPPTPPQVPQVPEIPTPPSPPQVPEVPTPPSPPQVPEVPEVPTPPVTLDIERLRLDALQAVRPFECADIQIAVSTAGDITASGYVASDADRQGAAAGLGALPQVGSVVNNLTIMKRPLCEGLGLVREATAYQAPTAPRIDPGGADGVYHSGENLKVTVTAMADGYLYVDYIDAENGPDYVPPNPKEPDRYVLHLSPNKEWRPLVRSVKAGEQLVIGTLPEEEKNYIIQPPFGTYVLIAITVPEPLFPTARTVQEDASKYFLALRERLKQLEQQYGRDRLPASSTLIEFRE